MAGLHAKGRWVLALAAALCLPVAGARAAPIPIVLPLRVDAAGLEGFALSVATPGSSLYGRYLTVAQLARRFGASSAVRHHVLAWLRGHGAWDVRVDATGLLARARMNAAQARVLFAPGRHATVAAVPLALSGAVTAVLGLDRTQVVHDTLRAAPDAGAAAASSELPRTGTAAGCPAGISAHESHGDPSTAAFTPNQYVTAYGLAAEHRAGYLGQGMRVALIETDSVKASDVRTFATCFRLRLPPIHTYAAGGSARAAAGGEATSDTEVLDAAAPRLTGIDVYEAGTDVASFLGSFGAPLRDPRRHPAVIEISAGACEPVILQSIDPNSLSNLDLQLLMAEASGTSVVVASGDDGSSACQSTSGPDPVLAVDYPASSSFVTAVGGTNLALTAQNVIARQLSWNDAPIALGAGGGGFSSFVPRPRWQRALVPDGVGRIPDSTVPGRALPDVALLADVRPGYAIYCTAAGCPHASTGWVGLGGTSLSAPLLAGGIALVDQYLRARQRWPLGYLAPFLYAAATARIRGVFGDVTQGGNDLGRYIPGGSGKPLGCCRARTGYDEATGLGGVDIAALSRLALTNEPNLHVRLRVGVPGGQQPVGTGRLVLTVSCSTDCEVEAAADVRIAGGPAFARGSGVADLSAAGTARLVISFSAAQVRRLRGALRRHRTITARTAAAIRLVGGFVYRRSAGPTLRLVS